MTRHDNYQITVINKQHNLLETGILLCRHDNLVQVTYADTQSAHVRLCCQINWHQAVPFIDCLSWLQVSQMYLHHYYIKNTAPD